MTVKRIVADNAHDALVDAMADLMHVHEGDGGTVLDLAVAALPRAVCHYQAEKAGEDGARIEVLR